ncbi:hypothetical protein PTTG_02404 [Puccinia triticina 1-1 BBBD Race 1]|uniref:Cytochrome b561 domain-containing protein n=2 Tax=Puccinia triticina TaxID=208348 RepID=A0A0C4ENQ7_PUCT1|nr:uncharacterized protein PtA15_4A267 [Puccinia triticina]OAV99058.1 hypothetical protein PTTG_02404 [Puccinia triticina 1-1 BBBD Race 1]WAQ83818.1 hypothetical protein PtA15_4A267 [Puccinia triticina]WAR54661.1 hypothetical protein PtB15_4B278 [Puccinia triticina]
MNRSTPKNAGLFPLFLAAQLVAGHNGHSSEPPTPPGSLPIRPPALVVVHIFLQLLTWGFLLPIGVILGLARSRLHAPVQAIAGLLLSLPATTLPHLAARHPYPPTLHATLGSALFLLLLAQIIQGLFLKSHRLEPSTFRSTIQLTHSIIGKSFFLLSWIQILLGVVASLSFCYGDHLGQCIAHMIMGSAFVGYGVVMLSMLEFGRPWLRFRKISQEYLDCCVITAWGVVNTFTEHGVFFSAGPHWSHKDLQHTFLGVIWASAGGLGIYLSRGGRRSVISGLVIIITGWAFQSHQQSLELSTRVHGAFGVTLMAAGLVKIITVVRHSSSVPNAQPEPGLDALDHLTPLLLTISGVMFMSATEEQLILISRIGVDHATYVLGQVSIGCLLYLYINLLIHFYRRFTSAKSSILDPAHAQLVGGPVSHKQASLDGQYERLSMENLLSRQLERPHRESSSSSFDDNDDHM